jgi:hypothetical protein
MRHLFGLIFVTMGSAGVLACSSSDMGLTTPNGDASTTGGAGGRGTGGTSGSGGRSSGGSSGASDKGGTSGTSGTGGNSGADASAGGAAGASGSGGTSGADSGGGGSANDGGGGRDAAAGRAYTWDFTSSAEGWTGGFADYPSGQESFYELEFAQAALPTEVGPGGGLRTAGNNHSDDLFMFVARDITGLAPSSSYTLDIQARIATNAPSDCSGIGGAPGTSVFFKIGATNVAPVSAPIADASQFMQMNIDKGNQGSGGADMDVAGDIGNNKLCPDETYELKTLSRTLTVTSDATGRVWIVLGTDSGFEGKTVLFYDRVTVSLHTT